MKPSGRRSAVRPPIDERRKRTLDLIGSFYDARKVGYQGNEGYRKSTDLHKFVRCLRELLAGGLVDPGRTVFMDLGCADGRVNVLMSYFVRASIGIEIDPDILSEYEPGKKALLRAIREAGLEPPPDNIRIFRGDSLDASLHRRIHQETGFGFADVDLFYTYITLHDVFGERIGRDGKDGALYLVYGFHSVLPSYPGLEVLIPDAGGERIAALFAKRSANRGIGTGAPAMRGTGCSANCGAFRIRKGAPSDRSFVAHLSRQVFATYGEYDRILPMCLDDAGFHTFVIEEGGCPAGFCMLSIGDRVGEVVAVAVDPLRQGRGAGRRLMQAAVEDAMETGIRILFLKTATENRPAQGLFRRIGFEETGREEDGYAGGQAAIGMLRRL